MHVKSWKHWKRPGVEEIKVGAVCPKLKTSTAYVFVQSMFTNVCTYNHRWSCFEHMHSYGKGLLLIIFNTLGIQW